MEVKVEVFNEVVAKTKSWELRFYRKERAKASKKLTACRTRLSAGGSASPKSQAAKPHAISDALMTSPST
jgi:hypothetical protein